MSHRLQDDAHSKKLEHNGQSSPSDSCYNKWPPCTVRFLLQQVASLHLWNDTTLAGMVFQIHKDADDGDKGSSNNGMRTQQYQGAWLLVDNGYLVWRTTLPVDILCQDERDTNGEQETNQDSEDYTFILVTGKKPRKNCHVGIKVETSGKKNKIVSMRSFSRNNPVSSE